MGCMIQADFNHGELVVGPHLVKYRVLFQSDPLVAVLVYVIFDLPLTYAIIII